MSTQKAMDLWWRYQYLRDNGHLKYVKKARKCEKFVAGEQWEKDVKSTLAAEGRPALTINKMLPTIANIVGEQIYNRTEISFRPRRAGATEETAEALTRTFMQISDNNQLPWVRTDVYTDGVVGSRGFFDVRLGYSDSLQGEASVTQLNPKNVLIDSDASSYDPDDWNDVIISKWLTLDDIELIYGKKWKKKMEHQSSEMMPYSYDSTDWEQDKFGNPDNLTSMDPQNSPILRVVRVLERQWKKLDRRDHLVDVNTGDIRDIPDDWERNDVSLFLEQNEEYTTIDRVSPRIRWTVGAGEEILHDEWSPYKHFTVVPFFPYFRRGTTIGVAESIIGPQELLNKVSSQELHVINTTANSGWKIKAGSLRNMDAAELESRGAQTGIVLELDEIADAEKIQPNQIPTGLERISYKAEEHIKTIAGVPDAQTGFAREDVSAKALKANQAKASGNFALVQDNMNRTDHFLARALLDIVQTYYTEERLLHITTDPLRRTTEEVKINEVSPEGEIINDLTLGEYSIIVTSQPERDTMEDSTFAQAAEMRKELNVKIPDSVLIKSSRLPDKSAVLEAIEAESNSEAAQQEQKLAQAEREANVKAVVSGANRDDADTQVKMVKARQDASTLQQPIPPETQLRVEAELAKAKYEVDTNAQIEREKMANQIAIEKMRLKSAEKKAAKKPEPKSKKEKVSA